MDDILQFSRRAGAQKMNKRTTCGIDAQYEVVEVIRAHLPVTVPSSESSILYL